MLLAKFEFDGWFHFSKTRNYQKKKDFPLNLMTSSWCLQMCMNGKINQGPLYGINVWCNRSLKTKLYPIIVRQYSHLNSSLVQVLGCSVDSKYSKWINSPPSYHSPKPSLRTHLSLNFSKTWNQFYMNCRNTRSLPSSSRNSPLQWLLNEK